MVNRGIATVLRKHEFQLEHSIRAHLVGGGGVGEVPVAGRKLDATATRRGKATDPGRPGWAAGVDALLGWDMWDEERGMQ